MSKPRLLTPAELEALRQDMEAASRAMRAEVARRRAVRESGQSAGTPAAPLATGHGPTA